VIGRPRKTPLPPPPEDRRSPAGEGSSAVSG